MKDRLISIVSLPQSKAYFLKVLLEGNGIECVLEDIDLVEGFDSLGQRVKILEKDIELAIPLMNEYLGIKPAIRKPGKTEMNHILVPVDFSPVSEKVSRIAFYTAKHLNMKLVFMHSYINPYSYSIPLDDIYVFDSSLYTEIENAEQIAQNKMETFIKKQIKVIGEKDWNSIPIEIILKPGNAENDILAYSEEHQSRLIVMGYQGKAGMDTNIMGSVTADVVSNARIPVLVIPSESNDLNLQTANTVLYATNFDMNDFVAIDKLMALLKPFETKVICIHVGSKLNDWDVARLEGMKGILTNKYSNKIFECRMIDGNDPLSTLENFIAENNIKLLAMTTHKRNMFSQLFNPSIARKMLFHTNTLLLVFHA